MLLSHPRVKVSIMGSLCDREVACSASDRQGTNFESCVWRTVSSQSSHHLQEVLLAQFSLYVHKGGLTPDSFRFVSFRFVCWNPKDNTSGVYIILAKLTSTARSCCVGNRKSILILFVHNLFISVVFIVILLFLP